jgi:hypothetical protein
MSHYSELTSPSARRGSRRGTRGDDGASNGTDGYDPSEMGSSYDETMEWDNIGIFGAGLAAGLILGAGLALLLAPRSGEETRELLGERSRWVTDRVSGGFDDLRGGVERATRRSRRKLRRGLTRGRWVVEDMRGR